MLVLEFCCLGTLENNLRDHEKCKQLFMKKKKICLGNEIAKGMSHLVDAGVGVSLLR